MSDYVDEPLFSLLIYRHADISEPIARVHSRIPLTGIVVGSLIDIDRIFSPDEDGLVYDDDPYPGRYAQITRVIHEFKQDGNLNLTSHRTVVFVEAGPDKPEAWRTAAA